MLKNPCQGRYRYNQTGKARGQVNERSDVHWVSWFGQEGPQKNSAKAGTGSQNARHCGSAPCPVSPWTLEGNGEVSAQALVFNLGSLTP